MTDFPYDIGAVFDAEPAINTVFFSMPINRDCSIKAAALVAGKVDTNPTSQYDILVKDGVTTIGTISISTGGVYSYADAAGDYALSQGDIVTFESPGSLDGTVAGAVFGLQVEQSIDVGGGGGSRVISEQDVSGVSEVVFDNLDGRRYEVIMSDVLVNTSSNELVMEVSTDNGSTWESADYGNSARRFLSNGSSSSIVGSTRVLLSGGSTLSNSEVYFGRLYFAGLDDPSSDKRFGGDSYWSAGGIYNRLDISGHYVGGAAVDAIRIRPDSGTLDGKFALLDTDAAGGGSGGGSTVIGETLVSTPGTEIEVNGLTLETGKKYALAGRIKASADGVEPMFQVADSGVYQTSGYGFSNMGTQNGVFNDSGAESQSGINIVNTAADWQMGGATNEHMTLEGHLVIESDGYISIWGSARYGSQLGASANSTVTTFGGRYTTSLFTPDGIRLTDLNGGNIEGWLKVLDPEIAGGGSESGAHHYWRVNISANNGDPDYTAIQEIELRTSPGGSDATDTLPGLAVGSTELQLASNAFDGNTVNANNAWATTLGNEAPSWIYWLFYGPVEIQEFAIMAQRGLLARAPFDFTLEYSDDGLNWTVADTITGASWTDGVFNVYTL